MWPKPLIALALLYPHATGTAPVPEHEKDFVINKLVAHRRTDTGMHYRAGWYGYDPTMNTYEPAECLPQPFLDRYWHAKSKRPGTDRRTQL